MSIYGFLLLDRNGPENYGNENTLLLLIRLISFSVYNRVDPFEVDPLPKTFYYPSKERELPEDERKVEAVKHNR